jgi:hypothetical protein
MFLRDIAFALIGVSLEVTIALVFPSSKSSLFIRLLSSSSVFGKLLPDEDGSRTGAYLSSLI